MIGSGALDRLIGRYFYRDRLARRRERILHGPWTRGWITAVVVAGALLVWQAYENVTMRTWTWSLDGPAVSAPVGDPVPWWNRAVFYEVFVRSFRDSDGDGNGDLRGLISRLDHLNDGDPATHDDLGVTGLWLMPVAEAASTHGYDITDHYRIERDYGTDEDFRELIEAAHARGIRVIVNLVPNHTSDQHPWFLDSASGPQSPKRDWYLWRDTDPGAVVPWDNDRPWLPSGGAYYFSGFGDTGADLDLRNPEVTAQMADVARFWIEDMGVDGFRLDAVRHLVESDGDYLNTVESHTWLARFDDAIDTMDPAALTVAEAGFDTPSTARYVRGDEADLAFEFALQYALTASIWSQAPGPFARQLATSSSPTGTGQFASILSNHDLGRIRSLLPDDERAAKFAAAVQLTLPGTPFLYCGDEIGMTGAYMDLARTPMQWSYTPNAGFSDTTWWMRPNVDVITHNVADEEADPDSLLWHYRGLIRLRTEHPALSVGGLTAVEAGCRPTYGYLRWTPGLTDADLVVLNFSDEAQRGCTVSTSPGRLGASEDSDGLAGTTDYASALAPGRYTAVDGLTGQPAAEVVVGPGGAIDDYRPVAEIAPWQALVLHLEPTG